MNLAFAVIFLWTGAALLFLASRGLEEASPWGAFQTVMTHIRAGA